jgi:hypothetical protein
VFALDCVDLTLSTDVASPIAVAEQIRAARPDVLASRTS